MSTKRKVDTERLRKTAEVFVDELVRHRGPLAELVAAAERMTPLQLDLLLECARTIRVRISDERYLVKP